ncbi:MAG: hypothetical protein V5A27_09025 [Halapricum sp.]
MAHEWYYNLNGLVRVRSSFPLKRLSPLQVDEIPASDLCISHYRGGPPTGDRIGPYVWDGETRTLTADFGPRIRAQLHVSNDGIEFSMTPLYRRFSEVDPIVQWSISHLIRRRGGFLLYAAAIARPDDKGILVVGPAGSGKTTTSGLLARDWNCRLLAEDRVVIRDGTVHGVHELIHLRRESPLFTRLQSADEKDGTLTRTVHRLVTRAYRTAFTPGVRNILAQIPARIPWRDGRAAIHPSQIAPLAHQASLDTCLLLQPTNETVDIRPLDPEDTVRRINTLNDWNPTIRHRFVATYAYLDTERDYSFCQADEELIRDGLDSCLFYEVKAPLGRLVPTIATRFLQPASP